MRASTLSLLISKWFDVERESVTLSKGHVIWLCFPPSQIISLGKSIRLYLVHSRGNRVVQMDVSTCERTIGALEQSTIYLYIIRALQLSITLWNGPDNRRCSLPYETKVSPSRTHSVIVSKTRRINNMEAPLRCLIEAFILLTFGDANLWESLLVNETFGMKQSLPLRRQPLEVPIKKALASRVSSPSPPSTPTTSRSRPCW